MKKNEFRLLMLVPFGLVSCFSGASESSTEEKETQKMQQQVDSIYKKMSQAERVAQLYGIRSSEVVENGKLSYRNVEKKFLME